MPEIPANPGLSFIGTALLFLGFFLVIAGLNVINIDRITVKVGPKTWGLGIFLILIGIIFLLPEISGNLFFNKVTPMPTVSSDMTTEITGEPSPLPSQTSTVPAIPSIATTPTVAATLTIASTPTLEPVLTTARITFPDDKTIVDHSIYVHGEITQIPSGQRAFLVIESVDFGWIYPQGEVLPDPAGKWLVYSVYESVGFSYETYVVATNNLESAETLASDHFRAVGVSILPPDTYIISESIVVQRTE